MLPQYINPAETETWSNKNYLGWTEKIVRLQ